jgi:hypothetical protein
MGRWTKVLAAGAGVAAVAAGGVALADASSGSTQITPAAKQVAKMSKQRGLFRGARIGRLTHGDIHLYLQGHDVDVHIDRGVLKSVTGDSIVLHELDGSDVTIPVDSSTRVIKMRRPASLSSLRTGDVAFAVRRDGGAAKLVRSPGHPPLARRGQQ